ncbi:MAG: hypothetical protein WCW56_02755 [Candidatus Paceibacterota bacterium]|jgi:hypothetical protein
MSIRPKVIARIQTDLSGRFRVVDNTGTDKKIIAGQFPDVILFKKDPPLDDDALFVMKVENGGELVDSLPLWKELGNAPSIFYIVVPEKKLDEAKKLADATGIKAKFAWYEVLDGEVTNINYE